MIVPAPPPAFTCRLPGPWQDSQPVSFVPAPAIDEPGVGGGGETRRRCRCGTRRIAWSRRNVAPANLRRGDDGALGGDAGDHEQSPDREARDEQPAAKGDFAWSMHGEERVCRRGGLEGGAALGSGRYHGSGPSLAEGASLDCAYFDQGSAKFVL